MAVLVLVVLPACGGCGKTDAERAAAERAEIEERIRDSNVLVPYRALKLTLRAGGTGREPEAVQALWQMLAETRKLPEKNATVEEARQTAEISLRLAVAFYRAKQTLREHDEDDYPLFLTRAREASHPWGELSVPGYDGGMEHLFAGCVLTVLDTVDQGQRIPMTEPVLYEFSRATPGPEWPGVLRTSSRAGRGVSFLQAGYHYAAEEELTAYLAEVEQLPVLPLVLGTGDADLPLLDRALRGMMEREVLRAAGHFLRAWNRMQLKRDEPAADDVEQGLKSLAALGVENELTWWGMAFVHFQRGHYEDAAASLDRLALSPFLDEPTRGELQASAQALRSQDSRIPLFQKQRAALLLVRALVARAGGLERILVVTLGEARGQQVYAPIVWLDRVQQGLAQASADTVVREAGGLLGKAREAGSQGVDALKEKLGGEERSASPAPP
ncbi:conserved uncharacterized protein [Stigmatella aurantiaca DW4/3-1]|uniref:Conserved uncharacterized protein n=2 Tax=Stigmatella aurantiaca TaxID=41 RepID=Q093W4_STIAD|nr:conserved uncharacterized protein [Stigmatella aurantiaca DW4/3-1]EAU66999.1 hypothetical protein STIAU_3516 [Stigmatella aurantiaca DW4/3-1]